MPELADKHHEILGWAKRRSLHIDPKMGRDEEKNVRKARHAATELRYHVERYDEAIDEGENPEFVEWHKSQADDYAAMLRRLRPNIENRRSGE